MGYTTKQVELEENTNLSLAPIYFEKSSFIFLKVFSSRLFSLILHQILSEGTVAFPSSLYMTKETIIQTVAQETENILSANPAHFW